MSKPSLAGRSKSRDHSGLSPYLRPRDSGELGWTNCRDAVPTMEQPSCNGRATEVWIRQTRILPFLSRSSRLRTNYIPKFLWRGNVCFPHRCGMRADRLMLWIVHTQFGKSPHQVIPELEGLIVASLVDIQIQAPRRMDQNYLLHIVFKVLEEVDMNVIVRNVLERHDGSAYKGVFMSTTAVTRYYNEMKGGNALQISVLILLLSRCVVSRRGQRVCEWLCIISVTRESIDHCVTNLDRSCEIKYLFVSNLQVQVCTTALLAEQLLL